jgi:hypothetical protein
MTDEIYDFEGPRDVLEAILQLAKAEGIEFSDPVPGGNMSSPLHSPISGGEIKEALEIALLVFKTGGAAAAFLVAVRRAIEKFGKRGLVRVTNRETKESVLIDSSGPKPAANSAQA